jgi:hypothetical protein
MSRFKRIPRDSLGLTTRVILEGMRWCPVLDRTREAARQPHTAINVEQG